MRPPFPMFPTAYCRPLAERLKAASFVSGAGRLGFIGVLAIVVGGCSSLPAPPPALAGGCLSEYRSVRLMVAAVGACELEASSAPCCAGVYRVSLRFFKDARCLDGAFNAVGPV